jgi:NAD-dependent deacetylase
MEKEKDALTSIVEWLDASREIVFLTGPEIIFESGIPDAADPSFNPDVRQFKNSIEIREDYWEKIKRFYPGIETATPTPCHEAIYEISLLSNVTCIMTQNVDGLHQKAGNENVLELFASIHWVTCPDCGKDHTMTETLAQLEKGKKIPACTVCSSDKMKPPISFPDQPLPHWEIRESWMMLQHCDLLVTVGATLENEPIASFPFQVMNREEKVVIISEGESPADEYVNAVLYGKANQVMPYISEQLKKLTPIS